MSLDYPKHSYKMVGDGLENVFTWKLGDPTNDERCPQTREKRDYTQPIKDSIIVCIGNTPMVRINNITAKDGIKCEVLANASF